MSTFEKAYGIERTIAVKRLPAFRSMAEYITYSTYTHLNNSFENRTQRVQNSQPRSKVKPVIHTDVDDPGYYVQ